MSSKKIISIVIALLMLITNILSVYAASYEYDALGRLTKVSYDSDDTEDKSAEYSYDAGGNITAVNGFETSAAITYIWNRTDGTNTDDFYTVSANEWNNAVTINYNGASLTKAVKMESSTSLSFAAPSAGTLKLVTYSTNAAPTILLNNVQKSVSINGETDIAITSAGTYSITKGTTNTYVYYMEFIPEGTIISTTETTTETTTEYVDHSLNYTWDFDANVFKTLGIVSETKTVDELTLIAGAGKTMEIELNGKELNGIVHEYALNTGGAGSTAGRAVSFAARQNTDIYITAKSVNSDLHSLTVANSGGVVGTANIDDTINVYRFSYTGNDDTLYVYGANGAIQIYSISLRTYSGEGVDVDTTWSFSSTEFSGISTITATQEIRGLSVYAGAEIIPDNYSFNGFTYTKALSLSGRGTNDSKSVSFDVSKNADIYVTAKATNEIRTLILVNEFGGIVDSVVLTTALPTTYHMNYTGSGDKLYLRSQNGGIKIYDISVKTENNVQPLNKTWKFNDCVPNDVLDDDIEGLRFSGAVSLMTDATANADKLYAQSLALNTTGTTANNNIKLTVPTDTALKVTVSSPDSTNRQVLITNQYGYVLGNVTTANTPTVYSMTTTCDNEVICIRSLDGCVYVQEIIVGAGSGIDDGFIEQREDIGSNAVSAETINNLILNNYSGDYKNQLTETEQNIYELFVQSFASENPAVGKFTKITYNNDDVAYNSTNAENLRKIVRNAFSAFLNDYPEIFWVDTVALNFTSNGANILTTNIWVIRNGIFDADSDVTDAISQLNTVLNTVATAYENGENEAFRFSYYSADGYDKVRLLYLYLLDNTAYSYNVSAQNRHNAYGALVLNTAESDGIARAFKLLCNTFDIPCVYASGRMNDSTSKAYAWNYVKVFGKWYMCDITSDIDSNNTIPEYAMVSADTQHIKGNPSIYRNYADMIYAYPSVEDYDCFIWGDANLSGVLDSEDESYALTMALDSAFATAPRNLINTDVNADGVITANDSTNIAQKYLNPDWNPGDPLDDNLRDMFGITGVAVTNERLAEFDVNSDSIVNVDDWVIAVNNVMSENANTEASSNARTYSMRKTEVTRQMILDLFE